MPIHDFFARPAAPLLNPLQDEVSNGFTLGWGEAFALFVFFDFEIPSSEPFSTLPSANI
jgi:hypothetical protein